MNFAETIGWSTSLILHSCFLFPAIVGAGKESRNQVQPEPSVEVSLLESVQVEQLDSGKAPMELAPPREEEVAVQSDTWVGGGSDPRGTGDVQGAAPSHIDVSDDAVRALNLVLDPSNHERFLRAAQDLGIRFLIYPPGRSPSWLLEVRDCNPNQTVKLNPGKLAALSKRAHDLTPNAWFRGIRNAAANQVGVSPTGARIVAAVPPGVDQVFLEAEREWLVNAGPKAEEIRTLRGCLVSENGGWGLRILGGE